MSGIIDWLFDRSATCERLRNDLRLHQGALQHLNDQKERALDALKNARAERDEARSEKMILTLQVVAGRDWKRAYEREAAARREAQMEVLRLRERLNTETPARLIMAELQARVAAKHAAGTGEQIR